MFAAMGIGFFLGLTYFSLYAAGYLTCWLLGYLVDWHKDRQSRYDFPRARARRLALACKQRRAIPMPGHRPVIDVKCEVRT